MTEARRRLARLIMPGWRGKGPVPTWAGGLLIFSQGGVKEATRFIRRLPPRMLVAVDVEEGPAERFPDALRHPSAMAVGATGDVRLARAQGRAVGLACRRMGIHVAFAPVVDVNSNPANPIINTRAFGGDPRRVAAMGAAFIRGCQSAGVLACAKHFPGHGDTRTDSHLLLPTVTASRDVAEARELVPFRAAVRAGVATVMTAHVAFPAWDGRRPATLSHRLVTELLRKRLGFQGLVFTDSLHMGGIVKGYDEGVAAIEALKAGCDILLDPVDPKGLLEHLTRAYAEGDLPETAVAAALARLDAALRQAGKIPTRGAAEVAAFERKARREVARHSITRLRGPLPGKDLLRKPSLWLLVDDGAPEGTIPAFRRAVRRRFPKARFAGHGRFSWAVVGVFAKVRFNKGRIRVPKALLASARRKALAADRVVALLYGSPYVVRDLPKSWGMLAAYGDAPDSLEAGLEVLAGRLAPRGHLPVAL